MAYVDVIREIVEEHMTPDAPIAKALTAVADAIDADIRGLEAVVERIETLEERMDDVQAQAPA